MANQCLKFNNYIKNVGKWYNIVEKDDIPEVYIYDVIGSDMWGDAVSPKKFIKDIKNLEKKYEQVNVRINSPGGFVHDAFAIYNNLVQSSLKINVYIDGLAASSASFIAMAGDNIYMAEASEIMIHDPWTFTMGSAAELRKEADLLDAARDKIVKIYKNKTNLSEDKIKNMMIEETWINADDSVSMGFATEIIEGSKAAACLFDLSLFNNLPENFKKLQDALQKRQKEQAMRDAGSSRNDAKKELSENYKKERDALINGMASKCFVDAINKITLNIGG